MTAARMRSSKGRVSAWMCSVELNTRYMVPTETATRFGAHYIAVSGNNSAMNQIRYGQIAKYGEQRGNVGNKLGDVPYGKFAEMIGGYGEEVREASEIGPALLRAREAIAKTGKCAVVNVWIDPDEYAPGTKAQTMYK